MTAIALSESNPSKRLNTCNKIDTTRVCLRFPHNANRTEEKIRIFAEIRQGLDLISRCAFLVGDHSDPCYKLCTN